jgi:single-strand DNA-binding protein
MAKGTVNKAIILGRLGKDPEVKQTQSGMQVASLTVATTELGRKDQNTGQRAQDETEWHRVTLFGNMAQNAGQYLKKGSQVYIEGRLKTEKWQDQNGQDRYTTGIIGNEMQFISGAQNQNQAPQNGYGSPQAPQQKNYQQQAPQSAPQPANNNYDGFNGFDDDLNF